MADCDNVTGEGDDESHTNVNMSVNGEPQSPTGKHVDPSYKPKVLKLQGTSIDADEFSVKSKARAKDYAKVLVLYTGGTIGMKSIDGGKQKIKNINRLLRIAYHTQIPTLKDMYKMIHILCLSLLLTLEHCDAKKVITRLVAFISLWLGV